MPTTIAVDLAKSVFEVAVSERPGRVRESHRLSRAQFSRFLATRQPATVVMEACGTAHFWARHAELHGHRALLLPPHAVRPYVTRNKTDRSDSKGLLEALRNEGIHPVPIKTVSQQTLTALHRLRSSWLTTRTARLNAIRGLLRELGVLIPIGSTKVVPRVRTLLAEDDCQVPVALRLALSAAADEIEQIEQHAVSNHLSLWDAMCAMLDAGAAPARAHAALNSFRKLIQGMAAFAQDPDLPLAILQREAEMAASRRNLVNVGWDRQVLRWLAERGKAPPTIVMTAYGDINKAVSLVHELGAFWFLEKPLDFDVLRVLLERAAQEFGFTAYGVAAAPAVALHPVGTPRVAVMHTWQTTQSEGWLRLALDARRHQRSELRLESGDPGPERGVGHLHDPPHGGRDRCDARRRDALHAERRRAGRDLHLPRAVGPHPVEKVGRDLRAGARPGQAGDAAAVPKLTLTAE